MRGILYPLFTLWAVIESLVTLCILSSYYFNFMAKHPILITPTLHWLKNHLPRNRFGHFLTHLHFYAAEISSGRIPKLPDVLL